MMIYPDTHLSASGIFSCDNLLVAVAEESAISCFGGNDGSLTVEVSGETAPYQYFRSNGDAKSTATELSAGMFSVNIIDAYQCFSIGYYSEPIETTASLELTGQPAAIAMG